MYEDPDRLFTLRVELSDKYTLAVTAYEARQFDYTRSHNRIDVRARLTWDDGTGKRRSRTVFKRGDTWCGVPSGETTDGRCAKGLVLSLLSMKPGDTDADYFSSYTEDQLWFADRFGEELSYIGTERYGE